MHNNGCSIIIYLTTLDCVTRKQSVDMISDIPFLGRDFLTNKGRLGAVGELFIYIFY